MGQLRNLKEIIVIAKYIAVPQKRTNHELPSCFLSIRLAEGDGWRSLKNSFSLQAQMRCKVVLLWYERLSIFGIGMTDLDRSCSHFVEAAMEFLCLSFSTAFICLQFLKDHLSFGLSKKISGAKQSIAITVLACQQHGTGHQRDKINIYFLCRWNSAIKSIIQHTQHHGEMTPPKNSFYLCPPGFKINGLCC